MQGSLLIASERTRQITEEGFTPEHDAEHNEDTLLQAAMCYVKRSVFGDFGGNLVIPVNWPWECGTWKPGRKIRMLVKAGALIAAEIDRLIAKGEVP